ncbi:MAG: SOS response-associated peptidase [Candidatus Thiodiazotropha sp. (ex Codakia rugifera)]|nr:SOS response-associated peptidase [Candidatus Thiodiazotropha sp. (ex Codakia rugifera)]
MCGRFYLDVQQDELMSYFNLATVMQLPPRYNIAPSQNIAAVLVSGRERRVVNLRWGLIPFWAKDEKIGYRTINARAETVESKPAYRAAFKQRRCLIPASGFFEWKAQKEGKQPYCIRPRHNALFAFAGLYEHWRNNKGEQLDTGTILVTDANAVVKQVHDRMPVILSPEHFESWLDPDNQNRSGLKEMLKPWPEDETDLYAVSRKINNPGNDNPECIAPLSL